jgi:hypothetical protein
MAQVDGKVVKKRKSVHLESKKSYDTFVVIADVDHVPTGEGLWPAFWTLGGGGDGRPVWPDGGEIDLIEGTDNRNNKPAIHTLRTHNCRLNNQEGIFGDKNRYYVQDPGPDNSFGPAMNKAGGGIWLMRKDENGIGMWFYPKGQAPAAVMSDTAFDDSALGTPHYNWAARGNGGSYCDMSKAFSPHRLVLNIELWRSLRNVDRVQRKGPQTPQRLQRGVVEDERDSSLYA